MHGHWVPPMYGCIFICLFIYLFDGPVDARDTRVGPCVVARTYAAVFRAGQIHWREVARWLLTCACRSVLAGSVVWYGVLEVCEGARPIMAWHEGTSLGD